MNETQDHTTEGGATAGAAGTEPAAAVAGSGTEPAAPEPAAAVAGSGSEPEVAEAGQTPSSDAWIAPEPAAAADPTPSAGSVPLDPTPPAGSAPFNPTPPAGSAPFNPPAEPTVPGGWPGGDPTTAPGWPGGPTAPAGAWAASAAAPGGWPAGAPTSPGGWPGAGWTPPASGWTPSGTGWQPPGAGWTPPPGGWVPPGQGWAQPVPPQPHRRKNHLTAVVVAVALVALLVGAGAVGYVVRTPSPAPVASRTIPRAGTFPFGGKTSTTTTSGSSSSGGSSSSASGSPSDTAAIAAEVDPGLVDINTTLKAENEEAAGTGQVLTSNGEVLTNNHVIEGATTISVTDIGNGKTYSATVVGYDRSEDVAVIQLKDASGLKTVSIGNSSDVAKGEGVVGIGNAGGVGGTPSVAGGSITALGQSITASDSGDGTSEKLTNLIQTNCDIQPGDSGGPLVNTSGKVVAMDTAASGSSGGGFSFRTQTGQTASSQGFSIPINEAITLAKKIEAGDSSTTIHIGKTAFIGIEVSNTGSSGSSSGGGFNFTTGATTATPGSSTTKGAHVAGTVPNEPADQAGLVKGDVITAINGKSVTSATALTSLLELYHPGNTIKLTWVTASGQKQSATVTLATGPSA